MAKQQLPTNFKDDVLAAQMVGKRRYRVIQNEDGTISLEDVTNYSQIGSNFGAAQTNATNLAVNESFDKNKVIDSLADIVANEATGYAAGALAVRELNGKIEKPILYSATEKQIGVTDSGEPVYQKTIRSAMTYFSKPSSGYTDCTISVGAYLKKILRADAHIVKNDNTEMYALPYSATGGSWGTWLKSISSSGSQQSVLHFYNNVTWGSAYTLVVTIDYTK